METPPPSQPSSSAPPPVIHQTTHALPSNYAFNQNNVPNGPGLFATLDEPEDAEVGDINTPINIAHADARRKAMLAARAAARKEKEKRSSSSRSSAPTPPRGRGTPQY